VRLTDGTALADATLERLAASYGGPAVPSVVRQRRRTTRRQRPEDRNGPVVVRRIDPAPVVPVQRRVRRRTVSLRGLHPDVVRVALRLAGGRRTRLTREGSALIVR